MATWKIENGFSVYDTTEEKIGTVGEVWENHFEMDTGLLGFGKNYHIPYSAIVDVRDGKVFVRTSKERLDSMGWESKEGFLGGGIAAGPERPLGGFQSGKGGGPLLEGDEKIVHSGGTSRGSSDSERWEDVSPGYRQRWEGRRTGTTTGRWEEHEPGYRYGWEMSRRPEYRGKGWNEVEPEFRRDWQSRYSDKPWDRASQSLREAWEDFAGRGDDYGVTATRSQNWSINQGWDVYDIDNNKVGTVGAISPNHFSMDTGFLGLGKNYNIPFNAISDVRDGAVYLRARKDNLDSIETDFEHVETPAGTYSSDWGSMSSGYRSRWQSRYGTTSGARWEDFEPSYRYGYEMRNRPEYRGRRWSEVEPEFRRDWSSRHPDKPWDRFGDAIRDAWENVTDRDRDEGHSTRSGMSTSFSERGDFTSERSIPLREEELEIERRQRKSGEVRISKDVEEERRSVNVPYTREEVNIHRRPVSGEHTTNEPIGEGETIRVPVHEEEIDVEKRTVTREELVVDKDRVTDEKRVDETLKREVPRVEKEGNVEHVDDLSDEERRRRERGLF